MTPPDNLARFRKRETFSKNNLCFLISLYICKAGPEMNVIMFNLRLIYNIFYIYVKM